MWVGEWGCTRIVSATPPVQYGMERRIPFYMKCDKGSPLRGMYCEGCEPNPPPPPDPIYTGPVDSGGSACAWSLDWPGGVNHSVLVSPYATPAPGRRCGPPLTQAAPGRS